MTDGEITPPPWHADGCRLHSVDDGLGCAAVRDASGAAVRPTPANLRMMARAPDLLKEVDKLRRRVKQMRRQNELLSNRIAELEKMLNDKR